jgi:hypothetical protein
MKSIKFLLSVNCVFLLACEKAELPIKKFDRGENETVQISMSANYKNQVWFSLAQNKVVSTNLKTAWDLGFECDPQGYHIILNSAKAMRAYQTNYTELNQINDTLGLGKNGRADIANGYLDSTAIGDWRVQNNIYIIHNGYDENGKLQGFYKLKLINVTPQYFIIEYGKVNDSNTVIDTIVKNSAYRFAAYSMDQRKQLAIEPKKSDYDLCFTQYTHIFYSPFQYYQVTGVLNNTYKTRIIRIENKVYTDITINDTANYSFLVAQNTIGYDWKTFSLSTNTFTIDPKKCFIISDSKGFFYKLHFIDFYDAQGLKGHPKFEFKRL